MSIKARPRPIRRRRGLIFVSNLLTAHDARCGDQGAVAGRTITAVVPGTHPAQFLQLPGASSTDPVAQIAARLFLSEGTVRNHLSSVIGQTGARTRSDALRIATERGWI